MKAVNVLRAASFRSFGPRLFDSVMIASLIESVKAKYHFERASTAEESSQKPTSFESGEVKRGGESIAIEQLQVIYVGIATTSIAASTRTSTDDSDFFLDDLVEWAAKKYRLDVQERYARAYSSALECVFDKSIIGHFKELSEIGRGITTLVREYSLKSCPDYQPEGFSLHFELDPSLIPSPISFTVQRRIGHPYKENKYFSVAPLKTQDHKSVLERLEKLL